MNEPDKKNTCIKVYLRQRPFTENEIKSNCTNIVHSFTSREVHIKSGSSEKKYNFSHIFGEEVPQRKIYNVVVSPLIENIISGYNCTVFAYGQTGTGKTHTIVGGNNISLEADVHNDPSAGMIPRAVAHLFSEMNKLHPKTKCTVKISFVEIYNEEVRDLLSECAPLRVYDNPESKGSVYIRGLREVTVCNPKEVYEILNVGTMNRQTTLTNLNAQSSRAHTLFTLLVETREIAAGGEELITTGKLHLVDLAGSENIERTGATDVRAREAGVINKSLLTLGKVIKALAQKSQHIPYRDSKLTRILQDSLGGNTKTCMIATISPDANYWDETVNTLDYANLALSIANYPQVNITRKRINYLEKLQDEMSKLRQELLAARTGEGVYVSVENYNTMLEDTEKSHRLILELIGQIRQLEECKRKNQQQYEELNEFFQQTKIYLETISRELELKKDKIKQHEAILNCKREREKKLSEKANLLLKVCEAVSRQEEIYYSKYESQCSVTLSNANLSKSILSSSVNYLEEAQNISNVYSNDQETFTSEVKRSVQLLKDVDDFGKIAQLSSEMQADNYDDFSLEKVFKSDIADYGESNTKKYFNRIHDNILAQLESQSKIKSSLEILNNLTLTKTSEMELKSAHFLNSFNDELAEKESCFATNKIMLEKLYKDMTEKYNHIQHEISTKQTLKSAVEELISMIEREDNKFAMELSSLEQMMETMSQPAIKYKRKKSSLNIKQSLADYTDFQTETVKMQLSLVDNVINDADENEVNSQNQVISTGTSIEQYLSRLTGTVKENLNQHNIELKNVVHHWLKKVSAIKESLFKNTSQSSEIVGKNINLMSNSASNYVTNIKKLVQHSLKDLQDMDKGIVFATHFGDTPKKSTDEHRRLLERFKNTSEEALEFVAITEDVV